ncbi:alpha/beta hydrolase [Panacibacter sp. DH6]|uniref:Alpha/beta hydrolase n=1 Tax=Panacibacter microcysteis TaxID=2793269 RepID=A0A931GZ39_9BACT|nr:dienelactone hydrolase family protein [Panacibacter microcysteis]MBG9377988.1 alpha/beta hydrolase [Panacibacter microcysteis]
MNTTINRAGKTIETASKALVMLHGRGASAEDILGLAAHLQVADVSLLAPQAAGHSWYPYSFMAPVANNEPHLTNALKAVDEAVQLALQNGIEKQHIYLMGFSQGACLAAEYMARNADRFGGLIAFTGGLIGGQINRSNYAGKFDGMPVFIGTSDPDFHVPVERVYATTNILKEMGAVVTEKVYSNMGHTINQDEIDHANRLLAGAL